MKLNGNKIVFGYVNAAAFNRRPEGDHHWFLTREARDEALAKFRASAVNRGLAPSAAQSGIWPVKSRASALDTDTREALELGLTA